MTVIVTLINAHVTTTCMHNHITIMHYTTTMLSTMLHSLSRPSLTVHPPLNE